MLTEQDRREIGLAREVLRKRAGLTQAQLATAAGLDPRSVRRAEDGESLNEDTLRAIAHALGVEFVFYSDGRATVAPPAPAGAP